MISDDEHEDVWIFLDDCGESVRVSVVVIDYPQQPGRSMFVSGVADDGRLVAFEDGKYVCDDGKVLILPNR
jgi:hypothetical protein